MPKITFKVNNLKKLITFNNFYKYVLKIPFIFWVQNEWPIAVVMNCDRLPKHLFSLAVAYRRDSNNIEFPPL
jgi:hypothetical protein